MPLTYRILPEHGLVYVRYEGEIRVADTAAVFARYMQDPDFRPGQKQLVDLSRVTGFERDYVRLMELQMQKAAAFMGHGSETLIVYFAPTADTFEVAKLAAQSWSDIDSVIPRVQQDEAGALALLGVDARRIADLLQPV